MVPIKKLGKKWQQKPTNHKGRKNNTGIPSDKEVNYLEFFLMNLRLIKLKLTTYY